MLMAEQTNNGLTLDGIVRANIGVFSDDTILKEILAEKLPRHGLKIETRNLAEVASTKSPFDVYLIDIYSIPDQSLQGYESLANSVLCLRAANPESKFIITPTEQQLYDQNFMPVRNATRTLLIDGTYKRPDVPIHGSDAEVEAYRSAIALFAEVDIFDNLSKLLTKPHIIKVGGSIFDLVTSGRDPKALERLLSEIAELHLIYQMILTSGGGLRQDVEKTFHRLLHLEEQYEGSSRQNLERQAGTIAALLTRIGVDAVYVSPRNLNYLDVSGNYLRKRVPVVSLSNGNIPPSQSDTHTMAIADHFRLPEIIFAKNTDGVYLWDPNSKKGKLQDKMRELGLLGIFELFAGRNKLFPQITARDILDGKISRYIIEADGSLSDNHVIEAGALRYLLDTAKYVQRVHVLNGAKYGTLTEALEGKQIGSYIVKG